mmetsp:Transcript_20820/g.36708  ORF Transcript_20820/g.36708 Transcript_20820/m.36708 type:complete len:230 (-) Transcript_20820:342-1031(-)
MVTRALPPAPPPRCLHHKKVVAAASSTHRSSSHAGWECGRRRVCCCVCTSRRKRWRRDVVVRRATAAPTRSCGESPAPHPTKSAPARYSCSQASATHALAAPSRAARHVRRRVHPEDSQHSPRLPPGCVGSRAGRCIGTPRAQPPQGVRAEPHQSSSHCPARGNGGGCAAHSGRQRLLDIPSEASGARRGRRCGSRAPGTAGAPSGSTSAARTPPPPRTSPGSVGRSSG